MQTMMTTTQNDNSFSHVTPLKNATSHYTLFYFFIAILCDGIRCVSGWKCVWVCTMENGTFWNLISNAKENVAAHVHWVRYVWIGFGLAAWEIFLFSFSLVPFFLRFAVNMNWILKVHWDFVQQEQLDLSLFRASAIQLHDNVFHFTRNRKKTREKRIERSRARA